MGGGGGSLRNSSCNVLDSGHYSGVEPDEMDLGIFFMPSEFDDLKLFLAGAKILLFMLSE